MNKLNTLFLNEYAVLDDACKAKFKIEENGVERYIDEMNKASDSKEKISVWEEDYHTLNKCMHIYSVITLHENKLRKPQCTKQDIAWIKKFASRINKDADAIAKLKKYEATVAKFKETLEKAIPVAQNIAIGCGVTLVATAILGKKKKK
jgi:hypothetical protein